MTFPRAAVLGAGGGSSGGDVSRVAGRVRAVDGRFQNDAGWWVWRGIADFAAVAYVLRGRERELTDRLDAYARQGRNNVRIAGMLGSQVWVDRGVAFSPVDAGYWDALGRTFDLCEARGLYVDLFPFADAQIIVPDRALRRHWLLDGFAPFLRQRASAIPAIVNEARQNGWSEADDPELLSLADEFAAALGHRDFSISDPADGNNQDASAETSARLVRISEHCNVGDLHPDRSEAADKWRRSIDHLEGITDVLPSLRPPRGFAYHEPKGAGNQATSGRTDRESDPDALAAAQFVAACCGLGYTYHWIPEEHAFDVHALPGLEPAVQDVLARIPSSPDWVYRNDSLGGAPTDGITWTGKPGKLRNLVRGNQAWSVAYGEGDFDSVRWRPGYVPRVEYRTSRLCVWAVNQ